MKRDTSIEDMLALQLKAVGIAFEREVTFAPPRKWRADFLIASKVKCRSLLVECEGSGAGGLGRHQRVGGFHADMDKYNAAALLGFYVMRFSRKHVNSGDALRAIEAFMSMQFWIEGAQTQSGS